MDDPLIHQVYRGERHLGIHRQLRRGATGVAAWQGTALGRPGWGKGGPGEMCRAFIWICLTWDLQVGRATSQLAHSAWPLGELLKCPWVRGEWLALTGTDQVTSQIKPDQARSSQWGLIHYQLQTAIFCLRLNPSISQQIYWVELNPYQSKSWLKTNAYCTLSYTKGRLFHEKLPALNIKPYNSTMNLYKSTINPL